jgi:hypothetical protein
MAVITFDFDDTLTLTQWDPEEESFNFIGPNKHICQTLREHVNNGDHVHIVTSRHGPEMNNDGEIRQHGQPSVLAFVNEHLADVVDRLAGIHFTSGALKWNLLHELRSDKHFDDDRCELDALPPGIQGVLVSTLHGFE